MGRGNSAKLSEARLTFDKTLVGRTTGLDLEKIEQGSSNRVTPHFSRRKRTSRKLSNRAMINQLVPERFPTNKIPMADNLSGSFVHGFLPFVYRVIFLRC